MKLVKAINEHVHVSHKTVSYKLLKFDNVHYFAAEITFPVYPT
jgi:hypothetical protein